MPAQRKAKRHPGLHHANETCPESGGSNRQYFSEGRRIDYLSAIDSASEAGTKQNDGRITVLWLIALPAKIVHRLPRHSQSMKFCSFFWLGFAGAICLGQTTPSQSPSPTQVQEELLDSISQRVRSGDYKALFEAAKLPPEIAIPYISYWGTARSGPQAPNEIVRAALIQVRGYAGYIKADIAKAGAVAPPYKGMVPWYDFETLSLISTPEAAAIVAPYLFDFQMRGEPPSPGSFCGTCTQDANCDGAVLSLELMNWGDAPAGEYSRMENSAILIAWQKWAISKGYVPKGWSSRVQAPAWMLQMEAFGRTPPYISKQADKSPGPLPTPQAATSGT